MSVEDKRCTCDTCKAHDRLLAHGSLRRDPLPPADPRDVPPCGANKHRQLRQGGTVTVCPDCGESVAEPCTPAGHASLKERVQWVQCPRCGEKLR